MPRFAYVAIDPDGKEVTGAIKSDTLGDARQELIDKQLFPVRITEKRGALDFELTKEKVKKKELMNFTRQLAVFIKAGVPVVDALNVIGDETGDVALRRAITGMVDDLRNGGSFSDSAVKYPQVFPAYYIGILQSAELTGKLDTSLESLADFIQREMDTRSKVVSALSYPIVVMSMAMVTVLILAGYVLPQFKPLFEELGADLPLPTRMMLFIARFFGDLWYVTLISFLLFFATVWFLFLSKKGKPTKDRLMLKIPVIKGIVDYAILERFCSILGTMVIAGVSMPQAMETTTEATANVVYKAKLDVARRQMLEGGGFSASLIATELFPGAARQMFKVGEETGTLDRQLEMTALYFNRELEQRIKRFTTLFEPLMIVFVGLIVGFVAIALVSAMYGVLGGVKDQA
jgi:type IV pilus assembly protein PilC